MLIRVHAAGLNPVDSAIRDGQVKEIFPVKFPWIPGSDVSGVVEEVGGNVTRFKTNDEVFALLNPAKGGAYAEYVVVRESDVALEPKSLQHIRAAQFQSPRSPPGMRCSKRDSCRRVNAC
jgi:NADPH:quinone reductase-like Zn-dependent oxidoreductase